MPHRSIIEPFRIKSVQAIDLPSAEEREVALQRAGYNLFGLHADEVIIDLLTDFQLQIEHAVDLEDRERILFVDASVSAKAPFEFYRLKPVADESYTTHAMSPESLLATYQKVNNQAPPPAFMLSIRGYEFDLGLQISYEAVAHLTRAQEFINLLLSNNNTDYWEQQQK